MTTKTVSVVVDAMTQWQTTNIIVQQGASLTITPVNASLPNTNNPQPWPNGPYCDPDGNRSDGQPVVTWSDAIAPDIVEFSLVGRIGTYGAPFLVGTTFNSIPANATGRLYLSFNDGVHFDDNSGHWDVNVTYETCVNIDPTDNHYGTSEVIVDQIDMSLYGDWGVVLTVQCGTANVNAVWTQTAKDNLVSAFTLIDQRLSSVVNGSGFAAVFGGLELRFVDDLGTNIAGDTFNGYLIRFSNVARTTITRLNSGTYGRTDTGMYPSQYGFFVSNSFGIQNTVIHELGHVFYYRATDMITWASNYSLMSPEATDTSPDQGKYWEHGNSSDIHEIVPDNFLNWVRDSYLSATPDVYNDLDSDNNRRIEAYWVGHDFVISGSDKGTSPGIQGFSDASSTPAEEGNSLLYRLY